MIHPSLSGLRPSIGSVGDAFDNALAETTIGLCKTEAVREDSPLRCGPLTRLADVELLTCEWVNWYNESRLMHRLAGFRRSSTKPTICRPRRATGRRQINRCASNPGRFIIQLCRHPR